MAYPIGGPGNARFLVMELHYDNPDLRSGMFGDSLSELNKQMAKHVVKHPGYILIPRPLVWHTIPHT